MPAPLSAGKLRRIRALADARGRFKMMAIDQRGSLVKQLSTPLRCDPDRVPFDAVAKTKQTITRILAPHATAVLTDPIYGYPYSVGCLPHHSGVLLACEESGYDTGGPGGHERRSSLIDGWTVEKAQRAGADAIKILLYTHPDASEETQRHQQSFIRGIGDECVRCEMPLVLELVVYPLDGGSTDRAEFARQKPELVARSAAEFSRPDYRVDILKLEFPCNLKYAREFAEGFFDGKTREAAYTLDEVAEQCKRLDQAAALPWVILSAGVDVEEFLENVRFAVAAGASGFLCGRAIWKDAVQFYPDLGRMESFCRDEGAYNFVRCNAYAEKALPWHTHRAFAGADTGEIERLGEEWYRG